MDSATLQYRHEIADFLHTTALYGYMRNKTMSNHSQSNFCVLRILKNQFASQLCFPLSLSLSFSLSPNYVETQWFVVLKLNDCHKQREKFWKNFEEKLIKIIALFKLSFSSSVIVVILRLSNTLLIEFVEKKIYSSSIFYFQLPFSYSNNKQASSNNSWRRNYHFYCYFVVSSFSSFQTSAIGDLLLPRRHSLHFLLAVVVLPLFMKVLWRSKTEE